MTDSVSGLFSIGGELELDTLVPSADASNRSALFINGYSVSTGRTALRLVARAIKGRRALLPAYLCASMLQPFREEGYDLTFFPIESDLRIDPEKLEECACKIRPDILVFINYFGFPQPAETLDVLNRLKSQITIVEDCTQGSLVEFSTPIVGCTGDFVMTSFRKYLPVPDGGVLFARRDGFQLPALPQETGLFVRYRLLAKYLRWEYLNNPENSDLESYYLTLFSRAESEINAATPLTAMSQVSSSLFSSLDLSEVARRRRLNFNQLLNIFNDNPRLLHIGHPLFENLPANVSPLFFPVRVRDGRKRELQRYLNSQRIFCPTHWEVPKAVPLEADADERKLELELLSLPIDQRYGADHMARLTETVLNWERVCQ